MAKTKLTVTHNGKTYTRTTDHKYTFVVVGRRDYERAKHNAANPNEHETKNNKDDYNYFLSDEHAAYCRSQNQPTGQTAAHGRTMEEYLEFCRQVAVAYVESGKADGHFDIIDISWHHTEKAAKANATKYAQRFGYLDVAVVPVTGTPAV